MAQIVEFPVAAGGVLRVQAADDLPDLGSGGGLVPATGVQERVGQTVERAKETLESAIGSVTPALGVITRQLRKLGPDEVTVEFGLVLSAEQGAVIAKASGEIHFTVTLAWKGDGRPDDKSAGGADATVPASTDDAAEAGPGAAAGPAAASG